jgi:hypothetical protein
MAGPLVRNLFPGVLYARNFDKVHNDFVYLSPRYRRWTGNDHIHPLLTLHTPLTQKAKQ